MFYGMLQVSSGGALVIDASAIESNKMVAVDSDTGDTLQEVTLNIDTEVHIPEGIETSSAAHGASVDREERVMDTTRDAIVDAKVNLGESHDHVDVNTSHEPVKSSRTPTNISPLAVNTSGVPASSASLPVVTIGDQGTPVINVAPADMVQSETIREGKQPKSHKSKPGLVKGPIIPNPTTVIPVEPAEPTEPPKIKIPKKEPEEEEDPSTTSLYGKILGYLYCATRARWNLFRLASCW